MNMSSKRLCTSRLLRLSLGLSLLVGASCSVGPNYKRPAVATPSAFKRAQAEDRKAPAIANTWWTLFNDPELTSLAEKTLAANLDIQASMARVEESRAALGVARGDYFPSATINPSMRRSHTGSTTTITTDGTEALNGGGGSGATVVTTSRGRTTTTYSLPLNLSYEVDIWGRLRRQVEYYRDNSLASEADLEFVRQTAAADVAQAYFSIRLYDTQIETYQRSLDLFRRQLDLTQTKVKAGLSLQTDVLQAQTQVNSSAAQLIEVQRARAKQEHAIAILLGVPPSEFSLPPKPLTTPVPVVPAGIPAALLNQRPDVAAAEHRLAAANAQVGVATANFYPSFSIGGSVGYQSSSRQNLTDWANHVWSLTPSINLPVFQGGALRGTLIERRAAYRELVANYRSAVLSAYKDVEDQLSDLHLLAEKSDLLNATVASAREYARLTELQYRQGITGYLQVIDANQTLLTNELSAAQAQNQRLAATVLLIKALGGGWTGGAEQ